MGWQQVREARRRLSREQGAIFKDWGGRIPIALIYPSSYRVGMSNLGVHAIYALLNSYPQIVCERFFYGQEVSLESQRPLQDFAVLAFSVSYELDYFNVVQMLKTSGIPLFAAERDERHPLVMGGGPCLTANPQPLAPLFDCFVIGEGEAVLPPMLDVLARSLAGSRQDLLPELASLAGVYVPGCPQDYVKRCWLPQLDDFDTTTIVATPDTELGDMWLMEIERGCGRGCRFCLAGYAFRPMRWRSLDRLLAQAETGLRYRGRLGLVGAAVLDHPQIEELLARLRRMGAGLSLSSLRTDALSPAVLGALVEGGAKTVTLAPEAGSHRLRQLVRKGLSEDDILRAVDMAAQHRIGQLKLYFMIGLPTEEDEDVQEIARLSRACQELVRRRRSATRITLNIAPFVPKAGTPFQWLGMASTDVLSERLSRLRRELKGIEVKAESVAWSQVQAVLARGDADLAHLLAGMAQNSLAAWRQAMAEGQVELYAHRRWPVDQRLPWSVLESAAELERLKAELII